MAFTGVHRWIIPLSLLSIVSNKSPALRTGIIETAMVRKAAVKYRSLRSNLVNLPLSLYAQLVQQQAVSIFSRSQGNSSHRIV